MGIRDYLERVAAWFGFGVNEEDYYDEEEERPSSYAKDRYAGDASSADPGPTVRRLGRTERSSAFGASLGDLFSREGSDRDRSYSAGASGSHLRPVPDSQIPQTRVSVIEPASFNDAQALADRFKRQQPVILNLQRAGDQLSTQIVDYCAGLAYASDGQIQVIADRLFLLTPRDMEVSDEKRERLAERTLFNQF